MNTLFLDTRRAVRDGTLFTLACLIALSGFLGQEITWMWIAR